MWSKRFLLPWVVPQACGASALAVSQGYVADAAVMPLQGYFMKLVDETVEHSVKHVRTFVHQYLSSRLDDARSQIEQYGSRYTEAMLHALETSKQGDALATMLACCQEAACMADKGLWKLAIGMVPLLLT